MNGTQLSNISIDMEKPTLLFSQDNHEIYWLGIPDETVFRCNTYLIKDGDEAIIVDPGNRAFFSQVKKKSCSNYQS